jgi:hypothetical protein
MSHLPPGGWLRQRVESGEVESGEDILEDSFLFQRLAKHHAYISRREVKVFGVKILLYEWVLTRKIFCGQEIAKVKIIYFSKRPPFSVC